jgi:hypothetical protein
VDYQATKTRSLSIAFVLDAESLRQLATVLGESGRDMQFTVKWADGTSVPYPSVEEVIQQPNSKENPIISLIAETSPEDSQSASIVFRKNPDPTVEYTINGPQRNVVYLTYKLDQWVSTTRQWYSLFSQSGYAALALLAACAAPIILWNYVVSHFFPNLPKDGTPEPWEKSVWIVGVWVFEGFSTKMFPKATFALGHGTRRHEAIKSIRGALLYAVPSSIVLGLIAAWLYDHYR